MLFHGRKGEPKTSNSHIRIGHRFLSYINFNHTKRRKWQPEWQKYLLPPLYVVWSVWAICWYQSLYIIIFPIFSDLYRHHHQESNNTIYCFPHMATSEAYIIRENSHNLWLTRIKIKINWCIFGHRCCIIHIWPNCFSADVGEGTPLLCGRQGLWCSVLCIHEWFSIAFKYLPRTELLLLSYKLELFKIIFCQIHV